MRQSTLLVTARARQSVVEARPGRLFRGHLNTYSMRGLRIGIEPSAPNQRRISYAVPVEGESIMFTVRTRDMGR